jgi:hypothetical protein
VSSKQISLTKPVENAKIVGHFKESVRYWYTLGGLINIYQPDLDKVFAEKLLKFNGDAVCNLKLKDQFGAVDFLITLGVGGTSYLVGYWIGYANHTGNFTGPDFTGYVFGSLFTVITGFLISSRTLYLEGDVFRK